MKNKKIKERNGEDEKMEKMGLLKNEKMGDYEKEQGFASYRTLVNYFIGDIVLCNNIVEIDDTINYIEEDTRYYNEKGEEITEEEYLNDENAYADTITPEIYQYYLCNLTEWEEEQAKKCGLIITYSNILDCHVLLVDHWGTSWDYVLTSVRLFDDYEELKAYEEGEN